MTSHLWNAGAGEVSESTVDAVAIAACRTAAQVCNNTTVNERRETAVYTRDSVELNIVARYLESIVIL